MSTDDPNTLRSFISAHPDFKLAPESVKDAKLRTWFARIDKGNREGVRLAYLAGRVLLFRYTHLRYGEKRQWLDEQQRKFDRAESTLRLYMRVARAVDSCSAEDALRVLDMPLRKVEPALRAIKEGRDPWVKVPPKWHSADTLARRGARLLKDADTLDPEEREKFLRGFHAKVEALLPQPARQPARQPAEKPRSARWGVARLFFNQPPV